MRARLFMVVIVLAASFLVGCASYRPKDMVLPENVSLYAALEEIGCAFRAMHEAEQSFKVGEIPADMKVTLAITVSSKDGGSLSVAPTYTVPAGLGGTITGQMSQSSEASRANTIEINFKSLPLYVLDKVSTEHGKGLKPEDIQKYVKAAIEQAPYISVPESRTVPVPPSRSRTSSRVADDTGGGGGDAPALDVCLKYKQKATSKPADGK